MAGFAVSEEKNALLKEKMAALGVREEDIEEKFVRSSGHGGQKLNKTSSCVFLRHVPTGIAVKCMKDRSQSVNRFLARRELLEKVEAAAGRLTKRTMQAEKTRKQSDRRKRRAKEKYGAANA